MNDLTNDFAVYDHKDLMTFAQRVAAWCHWFDLPAPELPQSDGGLVLGDGLPNWKKFTPCSLDCIVCGDPRGLAFAYVRECGQSSLETPAQ